jgi:hypothetical protein
LCFNITLGFGISFSKYAIQAITYGAIIGSLA